MILKDKDLELISNFLESDIHRDKNGKKIGRIMNIQVYEEILKLIDRLSEDNKN